MLLPGSVVRGRYTDIVALEQGVQSIMNETNPGNEVNKLIMTQEPSTNYTDIYNQFEIEEKEKNNYEFDKIVDHYLQDGVLILKIKY